MQIKWLRFLSTLIICCVCNVAVALPSCKEITSVDGEKIRNKDISENQKFKNTNFTRFVCEQPELSKGIKRCVKLTDIQVQSYAQAIYVAKNYALERYNDDITCHTKYYECLDNDDHILCANLDDSVKYEFIFDDITEKYEPIYKKGIGTAFCKIYMGDDSTISKHSTSDIVTSTAGRYQYKRKNVEHSYNDYLVCEPGNALSKQSQTASESDDLISKQADKLANNLNKDFGYSATTNGVGFITIDFHTLDKCPTLNVVTRFKNQQINLDQNVTAWLGMYYARDHKFSKFKCDLAPSTCKTDEYLNPWEDMLTCYADGVPVRFLFDDLSEGAELKNESASSMMQCMSTNGEFDGRYCRGLTQQQCKDLNSKVPGGTDWNTKLDTCVLKSSVKLDNLNQTMDVLETVGGAALVAVATVVTGGGTLVVIGVVGTAASAAVSKGTEFVQRGNARQYLSDLEHCNDADCARSLFEQYFEQISYYDKAIDDNMALALDNMLSEKTDLFEEKEQMRLVYDMEQAENRGRWGKYLTESNIPASAYVKDTADVLKVVFTIMSLSRAPQALATGKLTNPFGNVKLAKTTDKIIKLIGKIKKVTNSPLAGGVNNVYDLFDVVSTTADAAY